MWFSGRLDWRAAIKDLVIIQQQIQTLQNNSIEFYKLVFFLSILFLKVDKKGQDMNCDMDKLRKDLDDQGFLVLNKVLDSDSLSLYCGLYEVV